MSGGSYNYVHEELTYLRKLPSTEEESDLRRLVERAEELRPGSTGARRLRAFLELCERVYREGEELFDLMHTIDRLDSGDDELERTHAVFDAMEPKT